MKHFVPTALVLSLSFACQGTIMDQPEDLGVGEGPGAVPFRPVAPETPVVRRLNAREYRHTMRDLFDIDTTALQLPNDQGTGGTFDTDGSSLGLALGDFELYYEASDAIARFILGNGHAPVPMCEETEGEALHACVAENLAGFLERAFRQPADSNVIAQTLMLTESDTTYEEVTRSIVLSTLISPYFIFHYKTPAVERANGVGVYEMADRLSYFLWSSMPDDELRGLAEDGTLNDPAVLAQQAQRLLTDPRSERFFSEFMTQWLGISEFYRAGDEEDRSLFADMEEETRRFALRILRADEPLARLMDSPESVLNERLAEHYEVEWPAGDEEWRLVTMPPERRGLLAQGSLLAARSLAGDSNPFLRGAWTAETILCVETPPPPPVPPLDENMGQVETVRELVERHRADPECGSCHRRFDYLGLALEEFDNYGRYRDVYDFGLPVDASGVLPDGRRFDNLAGLAEHLGEESSFTSCVAELLSTYALGRNIHGAHAEGIFHSLDLDANARLSDVVLSIISHEEFTGAP